ncbi:MAG: hypothetical protein NT090_04200 [Acidobacteria bacterium]|nr:hypothetical protein [Acidobacteriota bacterium]
MQVKVCLKKQMDENMPTRQSCQGSLLRHRLSGQFFLDRQNDLVLCFTIKMKLYQLVTRNQMVNSSTVARNEIGGTAIEAGEARTGRPITCLTWCISGCCAW